MVQAPTTMNITQDDVPGLLDQMTDAVRQSVIPFSGVSVPQLLQCLVDRGILAYPPPPASEQGHDTESLLDQASATWTALARLTVERQDNDTGSKAMRESAVIANEELLHRLAIIQGALKSIHQMEQAPPGDDLDLEDRLRSARHRKAFTMARLRSLQRKWHEYRIDSEEIALAIAERRNDLEVSRASRRRAEAASFRLRRAVRAIDESVLNGARLSDAGEIVRDFIQDAANDALHTMSHRLELEPRLENDIEGMEASLDETRSGARGLVYRIGLLQDKLDELAILRIMAARSTSTAQS